jgi:hypothetical protein
MPRGPTDHRPRLVIEHAGRLAELLGSVERAAANLRARRRPANVNRSFAANPGASLSSSSPFSEDEVRRLYWLRATVIAERHRLGSAQQACFDHQACRRLAFALWLRCRRSLNEEIEPEGSAPGREGED